MANNTQLVLDVSLFKAFSNPVASTPIHKFRVGGDGQAMIDLSLPLNRNGVYSLTNNFTLLIIRVSGEVKLKAKAQTFTMQGGQKVYDELSMVVNGFVVLTHPLQSIEVTNVSDSNVMLTIVGCAYSFVP